MKTFWLNNQFINIYIFITLLISFNANIKTAHANLLFDSNPSIHLAQNEQKNTTNQDLSKTSKVKKTIKKSKKIKLSYFGKLKNESTFNHRIEWINQSSFSQPAYSDLDVDNSHLRIKNVELTSQINLELKLTFFNSTSIVSRSHSFLMADQQLTKQTVPTSTYTQTRQIYHSETFIRQDFNDELNASLGLINFQWGPAEFASFSNPLFSISANKNLYTHINHGRKMAQLSYTPSAQLNLMYMYEFANNPLIEKLDHPDDFQATQLMKTEYISESDANNYVGITAFLKTDEKLKIGLYGQYQINEEFSIYTDTLFTQKNNQATNQDSESNSNSSKDQYQAIFGFRHSGDWDKRFEYIKNSNGLTTAELANTIDGIISLHQYLNTDFSKAFKNGFPLYGKDYTYLSLRIPDAFSIADSQFYVRHLNSLQDNSSQAQVSFEWNVGESSIANIQYMQNLGQKNTEFNMTKSNQLVLAFKSIW